MSDYAGFITGENLVIDGGRWLGLDFFENTLQDHEEQSGKVSWGTAHLS